VPFILIGKKAKLRKEGLLADVAPTVLDLIGIEKPAEMTGKSLIEK
jgi:2,3-bisphosphoglycerate-independent phosphoglycerate mutase